MSYTINSDLADAYRGGKWQRLSAAAGEVVNDCHDPVFFVAKANHIRGAFAGLGRSDAAIADILRQAACIDEFREAHGKEQIEQLVVSNLYPSFSHGSEPMPSNAETEQEMMRVIAACLDGQATARDFLAFAAPYALDDDLDDELRGEMDRLSLVADEVERFGLAPEVFLQAARTVSRRQPDLEFVPAAD